MIKIYAIRDRLIDYFMQPFVGPDDKTVLASVARLVNQGDITSDIAQAPHQFEVWKLGDVAEDGTLVPEKQYLQDCSSLIRPDLPRTGGAGNQAPTHPAISRHRPPEDLGGGNGADPGPVQAQAPATPGERPQAHKAAG